MNLEKLSARLLINIQSKQALFKCKIMSDPPFSFKYKLVEFDSFGSFRGSLYPVNLIFPPGKKKKIHTLIFRKWPQTFSLLQAISWFEDPPTTFWVLPPLCTRSNQSNFVAAQRKTGLISTPEHDPVIFLMFFQCGVALSG